MWEKCGGLKLVTWLYIFSGHWFYFFCYEFLSHEFIVRSWIQLFGALYYIFISLKSQKCNFIFCPLELNSLYAAIYFLMLPIFSFLMLLKLQQSKFEMLAKPYMVQQGTFSPQMLCFVMVLSMSLVWINPTLKRNSQQFVWIKACTTHE